MSDRDLRQLQRRFQETGAREDEAAWLAERLRASDLAEADLRLAAWLGHPAAGDVSGVAPGLDDAAGSWLGDLTPFGPLACVRVGVAAARLSLPAWEAGVLHGAAARAPREILDAAATWIACPCDEHLELATEALHQATDELDDFVNDVGEEGMWLPLSPEQADAARDEYEREVASQAESPERPKRIVFFAAADLDDRCGLVLDADNQPTGQVASVHLTFNVEDDPRWPSTGVSDFRAWTRACATYWPAAMPVAAAQAALWTLAPATLDAFPAFNASAPVAYACLQASPARVADAIRAEVVPALLG